MNVFFYSIKGGQGKTTHAVAYARHRNAVLITNDVDNGTTDIYAAALGENNIVTLAPGQPLSQLVKKFKGRDLVFDF
jgi:cellulose biosynthesis protein BcsQ